MSSKHIALPGAFDPWHLGHTNVLLRVLDDSRADSVLVIVQVSPEKPNRLLTLDNSVAIARISLEQDFGNKINFVKSDKIKSMLEIFRANGVTCVARGIKPKFTEYLHAFKATTLVMGANLVVNRSLFLPYFFIKNREEVAGPHKLASSCIRKELWKDNPDQELLQATLTGTVRDILMEAHQQARPLKAEKNSTDKFNQAVANLCAPFIG